MCVRAVTLNDSFEKPRVAHYPAEKSSIIQKSLPEKRVRLLTQAQSAAVLTSQLVTPYCQSEGKLLIDLTFKLLASGHMSKHE